MSSSANDSQEHRMGRPENMIPQEMLQQAAAARAGENDTSSMTAAERRHMGHDVSLEDAEGLTGVSQADIDVPPPAYGDHYGTIQQEQEGFGTKASVADDGRVNIRINQLNRRLSTLLVPSLNQLQQAADDQHAPPPPYIPPSLGGAEGVPPPPPMNVVIQVVGSRGDVQPFVALGKVLKETYGHRVRLATHPNFKDFVGENGLEFFSIGGDPQALMAFMVKNPGLMPGFDSLRAGDVGQRRKEVAEYLKGCWRSCFETGDGGGPEATDQTIEDWTTNPSGAEHLRKPFIADCIIANPPSFAHIHIAEKMGIPLHIMFTMPYSPTQAFPHPLANIQSSNADDHLTNYLSYALIDMLTWQGLGDVINRFRQRSLGLDEVSLIWAPGMLQRLKVPHTYCWSPALIPKPKDWGPSTSISGFFFLDLASNYTPADDLREFLEAGPPPVYIGFGSIVLDDPNGMTELIFDAVRKSGQRALVSKGWGGVGADELDKPEGVFMLGNVPHDWLFKRVSCVVHHGGAGTTAAGITAGKPTLVVPFFGDQPFWGSMVARAGAGPEPIHNKQLTSDNLAESIQKCLEPQMQGRAQEMAASIAAENGSELGAQSFHQFLDVDKMRCNLAPSRPAVWRIKRTQARLSAMAACTLAQAGLLDFNELKLFRAREYEADQGPLEPVSGAATAIIGTMSMVMLGVADFPIETLKALKIHPDAQKKKAEGKKPEETETSTGSTTSASAPRSSDERSTIKSSSPSRASSPRSTSETAVFSDTASQRSQPTSRANSTFNLHESMQRLNSGPLSPPASSESSGKHRMSTSMADALSGQLGGNRPRSRSGSRPRSPGGNSFSEHIKTGAGTAKGVQRIVGAGLKSPMDFSMGVSKGFHNAPKLYGDEYVRPAAKVTDFKSGLVAATKEFGLGFYDGVTGLVTQPVKGAMKEGPAGFVKGIGKGIGGVVLKPGAAIFGVPAYTMKGVYKEMQKLFGSSVQNYIIAARTAQGFDEYQKASDEEKRDVIMRWKVLQATLKKKRNPDEMVRDILDEQMKKKEAWMEQRKLAKDEKRSSRSRAGSTSTFHRTTDLPYHDPESTMLAMGTAQAQDLNRHRAHTLDPASAEERAVEEAIRLSVVHTSNGDAEEDARVERGIRKNMAEITRQRSARADQNEDEEMRRAMEASSAEAEQHQQSQREHDLELERALAQSLREHRNFHDSEDEGINSPLSEATLPSDEPPEYDPGHLAGTTQGEFERQQAQQGPGHEKTQQEKSEEEIVLEYIKKQSLLEEENRKKMKAPEIVVDDEHDEELQRALKLSMQEGRNGEASGSWRGDV